MQIVERSLSRSARRKLSAAPHSVTIAKIKLKKKFGASLEKKSDWHYMARIDYAQYYLMLHWWPKKGKWMVEDPHLLVSDAVKIGTQEEMMEDIRQALVGRG